MSEMRGNIIGFPGGALPPGGAPLAPGAAMSPPLPAPPGLLGPTPGAPGTAPPRPPLPAGLGGAPALSAAAPIGGGLIHPGMPGLIPPGMMLNPAYAQWQQISQAWHAENNRRRLQFLQACHGIRHDVTTGYKIDIEADSTVAPDEQAEKQARTEFLQSIMPLLQVIIPEVQQNPQIAPLAGALVMFGVRAFPAARSLEQDFLTAFAALAQAPPQPPQQGRNVKPPQELMQEAAIARGDQQVDMQKNQVAAAQVQVQQQKNAIEAQKAFVAAQHEAAAQQQEGQFRAAELAQHGQEIQDRSALEQARLSHLVMRDTAGIV